MYTYSFANCINLKSKNLLKKLNFLKFLVPQYFDILIFKFLTFFNFIISHEYFKIVRI